MKLALLKLASLSLMSSTVHAQDFSHCTSVYESASRNLSVFSSSYAELNSIYDDYCDTNGEVRSSATTAGIEAVIKSIPISLSGSSASASERMSQFCRTYTNTRFTTEAINASTSTVVVEALDSFNNCVAITRRGVTIRHNIANLTSTIYFEIPSNVDFQIQGVAEGRSISCTMQDPSDGALIELGLDTRIVSLKENLNVFCTRSGELNEASGSTYFPRTDVTIGTNFGPYSVIYPAEEILDVEFATQMKAEIDGLKDLVASGFARSEQNLTDATGELSSRVDGLSADYRNFRENLSVRSMLVQYGQRHLGRMALHIGCVDVNEWSRSFCRPATAITTPVTAPWAGDRCGYQYSMVICLQK